MATPLKLLVTFNQDGTYTEEWVPMTDAEYAQEQADATAFAAAAQTATTANTNAATVRQRAQQALATNDAYLALASPTQAQAVAQVAVLTRECNGIIRLLLSALNDVSDT